MTLDEYQRLALRTAGSRNLACSALGLCGEAGEYAECIKHELFHKHPENHGKKLRELGDVLWYLAICAADNGMTLAEVAATNIEKLKARYPDGFSPDASMARADGEEMT